MGRDRNAFHDQETELKKEQEVIMAAGKRKYQPFFIGGSYTIVRKSKNRPEYNVVNDGVCGYYVFGTYGEATKACNIINKAKITKQIAFSNEDEADFFRKHETDGSSFMEYILFKTCRQQP